MAQTRTDDNRIDKQVDDIATIFAEAVAAVANTGEDPTEGTA